MNKYTNQVQREALTNWEDARASEAVRTGIKLAIIAGALLFAACSQAATLQPGHIACVSEQALEQAYDAVAQKDSKMLTYLGETHQCTSTAALQKLDVDVVDRELFGHAKVRFWYEGKPQYLFVPVEATLEQ